MDKKSLYQEMNSLPMLLDKKTSQDYLETLYEVITIVMRNENTEEVIRPVLQLIYDFLRCDDLALTIFNEGDKEIIIDESIGFSPREKKQGVYKPGEGITGEVVASGMMRIIEDLSVDESYLGKAKKRNTSQVSFICVPIKKNEKIAGSIGVTLSKETRETLNKVALFLSIISGILSPPLFLRRQLRSMNTKFRNLSNSTIRVSSIIGNSSSLRNLNKDLQQAYQEPGPVIIYGEQGTGKTFFSRIIHSEYSGIDSELVSLNCKRYSEEEYPIRLFGLSPTISETEQDTKNDTKTTPCLLEEANNQCLLIEDAQLLNEETVERLREIVQTKETVIKGTLTHLTPKLIFSCPFARYTQLKNSVLAPILDIQEHISLVIPPLRERRDDIMALFDHFLEEESKKSHKTIRRVSTSAIELLTQYSWPGNISELRHVVAFTVRKCDISIIYAHMLPPSLQSPHTAENPKKLSLLTTLDRIENDLIIDALKLNHGCVVRAAHDLNISERILGLRIRKYNVHPKEYK